MITGVLPACSSLTLGSLFIVNLDKSTLGRSRLLFSTVNSLCIRSKTSTECQSLCFIIQVFGMPSCNVIVLLLGLLILRFIVEQVYAL